MSVQGYKQIRVELPESTVNVVKQAMRCRGRLTWQETIEAALLQWAKGDPRQMTIPGIVDDDVDAMIAEADAVMNGEG